jgi:hypothetical protein
MPNGRKGRGEEYMDHPIKADGVRNWDKPPQPFPWPDTHTFFYRDSAGGKRGGRLTPQEYVQLHDAGTTFIEQAGYVRPSRAEALSALNQVPVLEVYKGKVRMDEPDTPKEIREKLADTVRKLVGDEDKE